MYIKTDNDALVKMHNDEYMPEDYVVEFSENGIANVKEEVGKALVDNYDSIHKHNNED